MVRQQRRWATTPTTDATARPTTTALVECATTSPRRDRAAAERPGDRGQPAAAAIERLAAAIAQPARDVLAAARSTTAAAAPHHGGVTEAALGAALDVGLRPKRPREAHLRRAISLVGDQSARRFVHVGSP
jgi:hypothetical protein